MCVEPLTPAERRGALLVAALLALGAAHDLWRASRPVPASGDDVAPTRSADPAWEPVPYGVRASPGGDPPAPEPGTARIDLNRATARELDALPGVGPVLAERIIDHRRRHGPFRRREELLAVRGIGPRLFARLAPLVTVGQPAAPR